MMVGENMESVTVADEFMRAWQGVSTGQIDFQGPASA